MRLTQVALDHWREVDGYAVAHNMPDLRALPVDRFCNFVWHWWTSGADPVEVRKFESKLWQPPAGVEARGPWSAEAEAAAFQGLKASLGK